MSDLHPYERIERAYQSGRGVRLSPNDVRLIMRDQAIVDAIQSEVMRIRDDRETTKEGANQP